MQNKSAENVTVTQIRWVLNYTFPLKYANWTPQVALYNQSLTNLTIKDWCSRGANWGGVLEENGKTKYENDPTLLEREKEYLEAVKLAEEKAKKEAERSQAEIAASAPKAGDKGPDDEADDEVAKLEANAQAVAQASTATNTTLPNPIFGIETLKMDSDTAS